MEDRSSSVLRSRQRVRIQRWGAWSEVAGVIGVDVMEILKSRKGLEGIGLR